MKKKIILVMILVIFIFTGCTKKNINPLVNKEQLKDIYFDVPSDVKKTDKKSGTLDTGMDWEKNEYVFDDAVITMTCYINRTMEDGINYQEDLKDIKINSINYKYKERIIDSDYKEIVYYTEVNNNTYTFSSISKNNPDNDKIIKAFLDTIEVK